MCTRTVRRFWPADTAGGRLGAIARHLLRVEGVQAGEPARQTRNGNGSVELHDRAHPRVPGLDCHAPPLIDLLVSSKGRAAGPRAGLASRVGVNVPEIDEGDAAAPHCSLRQRGRGVAPTVAVAALAAVADQWDLALGAPIPRADVRSRSMPVGRRAARRAEGQPRPGRLAFEAVLGRLVAARQVPDVLAVDEYLGALLLEAIEPGEPLSESVVNPPIGAVGQLLHDLHTSGVPPTFYPGVGHRVRQLFDNSLKL